MKLTNLSPDEAARMILSLYDTIPAMDGRLFAAGLVQMLSTYPQSVIDLAAEPGRGLASHISFPNLANFRKLLDQWNDDYMEQARREKSARLKALPEPPMDPEMQARIAKGMEDLVRHLKSGFSPSTQP